MKWFFFFSLYFDFEGFSNHSFNEKEKKKSCPSLT